MNRWINYLPTSCQNYSWCTPSLGGKRWKDGNGPLPSPSKKVEKFLRQNRSGWRQEVFRCTVEFFSLASAPRTHQWMFYSFIPSPVHICQPSRCDVSTSTAFLAARGSMNGIPYHLCVVRWQSLSQPSHNLNLTQLQLELGWQSN